MKGWRNGLFWHGRATSVVVQQLSTSQKMRFMLLNSTGLYKSIADKALETKTCMIRGESGYLHNLLAIHKSRGPIEKIEHIR